MGAQRGAINCQSSQLVSVELGFQQTQLDPESIVFHGTQQNIFFKCVCWDGSHSSFLKSLLNLLQYCFCLVFWFFGPKACGILVP